MEFKSGILEEMLFCKCFNNGIKVGEYFETLNNFITSNNIDWKNALEFVQIGAVQCLSNVMSSTH